jgi:1,4-dihydroxy-2-naphthoate octaprenyltransferase
MVDKGEESNRMSIWVDAMRPRTLPLAIASIVMGTFLAAADEALNWPVAILCLITAIILQILSNLANDYGDSVHGADQVERSGPSRAVQTGRISTRAMKGAIALTALLAIVSGMAALWLAFGAGTMLLMLLFVILGAGAIGAAITYTAGVKPYGYAGLGDIAVLIFFGWVGVLGSYYLQAQQLDWTLFLPATSSGLLTVAVLNVNNIRDIESDAKAGKRSIPVRLGPHRARIYHWALLVNAVLLAIVYVILNFEGFRQLLFLLILPLLWRHGTAVQRAESPQELNPLLRQISLLTLLFVFAFGIAQLL